MAKGFNEFVRNLAFWEEASEPDQLIFQKTVEKLPTEAWESFEAQYFELARKYEEFAIWANLHEHKKTRELLGSLSDYAQKFAEFSQNTARNIDIGLSNLHDMVQAFPQVMKLTQAEDITEGLRKHYVARIDDPIVEDPETRDDDRPRLVFPRVRDAFIPQSYRTFRQGSRNQSLENEETWRSLPRREDLGAYILSYFSSPYSTESPLIILGHPGSGKSLLTTVLSAQLLSQSFTAIRVPLREVNSEASVVSQIEEHISRVTSIRQDSWAKISGAFKNNPPIVILDGYDELLQASGKVFASYLKDVQTFQKNEAEQGRPVRVVVTSRVTLIDKAFIPFGSTIIRLLEFSEAQRECWVSIWNRTNAPYFDRSGVQSFKLPDKSEPDADKVLNLAEQPLLLLMLALYDSVGNNIRSGRVPDRTVLYESLLRRFVVRERGKSKEFDILTEKQKDYEVEIDMRRLGVAAIGMYNRRKLHILSTELSDDLRFFKLERSMKVSVETGRPLSQAELLLGSFFFVHKSRALQKSGAHAHHDETSAFEFLHNTFGEFLTADFIIRQTLIEVEELIALGNNETLRAQREQKLGEADRLSRSWFACLVYTPLFTRPVILEMIREWINHVLHSRRLTKEAFLKELDAIVQTQMARVLSKRDMPSIMQKDGAQEAPFGGHPLLGHLAIYSINLILLRSMVGDESFEFDESLVSSHEDGARPWDQLTYLWRSWFSIENLAGVTAILRAERDQSQITVYSKSKIRVAESKSRLETLFNIGDSLGDNILSGVSALALLDYSRTKAFDLDDVERRLASENIDVQLQLDIKRFYIVWGGAPTRRGNGGQLLAAAARAMMAAARSDRYEDLVQIILRMDRYWKRLRVFSQSGRMHDQWEMLARAVVDVVEHTPSVIRLAETDLQAAMTLLRLAGDMAKSGLFGRYGDDLMHRVFGRMDVIELGRRPELALSVIELAKEARGMRWAVRFSEEMFERIVGPMDLEKWVERRPEEVGSLIRSLTELGNRELADRLRRHLLEDFFERMDFMELTERRPERAIQLMELAFEIGGGYWPPKLHGDLFDRLFRRVSMVDLPHRRITALIASIDLASKVGATDALRRLDDRFFSRVMSNDFDDMEWAAVSPDKAMTLIDLTLELPARPWAMRFAQAFFESRVAEPWLVTLVSADPQSFARVLRVVRSMDFEPAIRLVLESVHLAREWTVLRQLPISALPEVKWLARRTGDPMLRSIVQSVGSETPSPIPDRILRQ
jgi:hypothetical protein